MKQEFLEISNYVGDIRKIVERRASMPLIYGSGVGFGSSFAEMVSVLCFYAKRGSRVIFGGEMFEQIYLSFLECCGIIDKDVGLLEAGSKEGIFFVEDGVAAFEVANIVSVSDKGQKRYVVLLLDESVMVEEGVWDRVVFSSRYRLENLLVFIAYMGNMDFRIMPIADKWRSFGWGFFEVNGNSLEHLLRAIRDAGKYKGSPVAVLSYLACARG